MFTDQTVLRTKKQPDLGKSWGDLAQHDVIVVTGGCSGMPYVVAHAAKQGNAEIWGFTPECNEQDQKRAYASDDITIYDKLFYIPPTYDQSFFLKENPEKPHRRSTRLKYRNLLSTTHVDAGIIVAGGWGTMNEFTNLLYDGKPIGILLGTGGLADELPIWYPRLHKKSESVVHFGRTPEELVAFLLTTLDSAPISQ